MFDLQVMTAGFGFGQTQKGVEFGPSAWLRIFQQYYPSLIEQTPITELIKENFKYIPLESSEYLSRFPWHHYNQLTEYIEIIQGHNLLPIILGGDHSLGLASVQASLNHYDNLKLLWIDAHGDINTPESSPTGSVHGMPLAHLLGLWNEESRTLLEPENLVLFGIRDLDQGEQSIIDELGIEVFTASDIRKYGMQNCLNDALTYLDADHSPLHISFDVDSLDPELFPSTGVTVDLGISAPEAQLMFKRLSRLKKICAIDIVEYNPLLSPGQSSKGLQIVCDFLKDLQTNIKKRYGFPNELVFDTITEARTSLR